MFNRPIPRNRRERREMFKHEKRDEVLWEHPEVKGLTWQEAKEHYKPSRLPIDLGINEFKRQHPNEGRRVAYFKAEMWKTYESLKAV